MGVIRRLCMIYMKEQMLYRQMVIKSPWKPAYLMPPSSAVLHGENCA